MQGLLTYSDAWMIYLVAALVCWWCCYHLFFWLKPLPFVHHLFFVASGVLIFTPTPIVFDSQLYAPGFIVTAFLVLSGGLDAASHTYFYWGLSGLVGISSLLSFYVLMFFYKKVIGKGEPEKQTNQSNTSKEADANASSKSSADNKAVSS